MALIRALRVRPAIWPTLAYFGAMGLLLVSERIIAEPGILTSALRAIAVAGLGIAIGARAWRIWTGRADTRRFEAWIGIAYLSGCTSLLICALGGESGLARGVWPMLWLGSALPIVLMEMSLASTAPSQVANDGRISTAAQSGLQIVLVLITVLALNYVASNTERKVDLSFLQDTRPSTAVLQLGARLKEPVEVRVFYPQLHEVRDRLRGYFEELKRSGAKLDVAFLDEAIDHAAALKYRVQGNGLVVVAKENRRVPIELGLDWDVAKRQLQDFDAQLQWAINKVARSRKLYFVTGHGEADTGREVGPPKGTRIENPLKGIALHTKDTGPGSTRTFAELHKLLRTQGYDLDQLGTLGVLGQIPKNAVAVFLVGPSSPLFPEVLANDYVHMRKSSEPSDNARLVTTSFSTHPAVMTVSRDPNSYRMLFTRAGYLEEIPPTEGSSGATVFFMVHADPQTWADHNGNYSFDPPAETRRPYELAAAAVGRSSADQEGEPRLLVYADVDVVSDSLLGNPGNRQAILDALAYASMDEEIPITVSASDPMVRHTQQQDKVWFYSVSFGIPVLVLIGGLGSIRRPRKRNSQ